MTRRIENKSERITLQIEKAGEMTGALRLHIPNYGILNIKDGVFHSIDY